MTPAELAAAHGLSPGRVRAWLRANREIPRSGRWEIDAATAVEISEQLDTRLTAKNAATDGGHEPEPVPKGRGRDEEYVLDLCDEVLHEHGLRQWTFGWLSGDPNAAGRRARLPVDSYYPDHAIVVEYREHQHEGRIPFMDRRQTISGVGRGTQRQIYDTRRDELIPAHGLRLCVIKPSDLDATERGRLRRRDRSADVAAIALVLGPTLQGSQ